MTDEYAEQIADAAEIIDTLTSKLPIGHPLYVAAQGRAKRLVADLYEISEKMPCLLAERDALRDALWVATEHNALHFGEPHNTVIQGRAALAQEQGGSDV